MSAVSLWKWLVGIGAFFIFCGFLVWLGGKIGIPLGKLPGDVKVAREKFSIYLPIVTSLAISLVLTIVINLVLWVSRR